MAVGRTFQVMGLHLGQTGTVDGYNESSLPYPGQLGQVFEKDVKFYRLAKFDNGTGNVASVAGGAAHWKARADYTVTSDQTDAESSLNGVAGAFLGVVTDGYYCFVQMGGVQALVTDTTCAAGSALIATTTDLTMVATTTNTKGNQLIYAISTGTNTTTSCNAYWVIGNTL